MESIEESIEGTRSFWAQRYGHEISHEEAREINDTLYEFIRILAKWHAEDRTSRAESSTEQFHGSTGE